MFYSNSAWAAARAADPWLHSDNYYWWGSTSNALIYKEGGAAAAGLTDDIILDYLAQGGCNIINIVFDGVYDAANKKYTYFDAVAGEAKEFTLSESNVLPEDAFTLNNPAPAGE